MIVKQCLQDVGRRDQCFDGQQNESKNKSTKMKYKSGRYEVVDMMDGSSRV